MGKIRKTYSKEIKLKAIDMYVNNHMGSTSIANELGISVSIVKRWISHYNREGFQGLDEKRGRSNSPLQGRPRKSPESEAEKINRLEAENAYLKKLLAAKRRMIQEKKNQ
ncbi:helix-turn-helix domain-containing protein [Bacillus sp. AFS053548]|uniref:helix-turn-helix domain-containing protein n=1 Tax=Bacillus sp. AFS053548 TaxID=2033505 RepID=UPI000BFC331B|nr:helix-turn-helix domain-containing protein [Bacillus sp. AFS053548]PGM50273.1 transposase [Bacillus sp. AFS053548]